MIHEKKILAISFQLMDFTPSTRPTPSTPPTAAWVVEIGRPRRVAKSTTRVAAHCAQTAFEGVTLVMFWPIVFITCTPYMMRPTTIMKPARKNTQTGISVFLASGPACAASTAPKGPTEFATSFAPWAMLWKPAMMTTRALNISSVFGSNCSPSSAWAPVAANVSSSMVAGTAGAFSPATCTSTCAAPTSLSSSFFSACSLASCASRNAACLRISGYETPAAAIAMRNETENAMTGSVLSRPMPLAPL
mmetsp:Transcript_39421/g.116922  ORF Transcript_39421/g.116922 Transcript_39421/m.116922 type:complete len:248 (+) Transcript_39421:219-962(+)